MKTKAENGNTATQTLLRMAIKVFSKCGDQVRADEARSTLRHSRKTNAKAETGAASIGLLVGIASLVVCGCALVVLCAGSLLHRLRRTEEDVLQELRETEDACSTIRNPQSAIRIATNPLRGVCCRCGITYRPGLDPASHGYCKRCLERELAEFEASCAAQASPHFRAPELQARISSGHPNGSARNAALSPTRSQDPSPQRDSLCGHS